MNVDTGEFRALTEEVGALGRKVSALTGRVTSLGNQVRAAGEGVEQATTVAQILRNAGSHEAEYEQMLARARKGRHARDRHGLRAVGEGKD